MMYRRSSFQSRTNATDGTVLRLSGDGAELLRQLRKQPGTEFMVIYTDDNEFRLRALPPTNVQEDGAVGSAGGRAAGTAVFKKRDVRENRVPDETRLGAGETSVQPSKVKGAGTIQETPTQYRQYGSEPMAAAHEIIADMFDLGLVDKVTMRQFDEACLIPVAESFSPAKLKEIRLREGSSQAVFAKYLNVATSTVSQWERGERKPEGPSLKLLSLINAKGLRYIG